MAAMTKTKAGLSAAVVLAIGLLAGPDLKSGLEGWRDAPYQDGAGIWTDCNGNTRDVQKDRIRTPEECRQLIEGEATRIEKRISPHLKTQPSPLTMASFISFTYNVGDSGFLGSTVLKRWNAGDYLGACRAMFMWDKITVNGRKVYSPGLYNRRVVEHATCVRGLQ